MKWRIVGVSAGAVVIVVGAGFFYWSNQPVTTKITVEQNVKGATTPDYALKSYANSYFSANMPARFSNRTSITGRGQPTLLQQLFSAPGSSSSFADQLAITVGVLPTGGVQNVADVQLRARTPSYVPLTFSWLTTGTAYERTDEGYELDIFLTHGQDYAAIVLTGLMSSKEQLTHEMQLLVTSISWQ